MTTGDLFGFAEVQGDVDEPRTLVVYPRVIPLTAAPLTSRAPARHDRQPPAHLRGPCTRINGVRPYQPGDPVRTIDWKTSARSGQLEVKKTEPAVSLTTAIFLDLHAPAYSRHLRYAAPEWAIVVAASLANYLIEQRQDVGLGSNGRDDLTGATCWAIPPRAGPHPPDEAAGVAGTGAACRDAAPGRVAAASDGGPCLGHDGRGGHAFRGRSDQRGLAPAAAQRV